ncbi:HAD family hydrolase [Streptomyces sp. NPDC059070]|uniref:HAD family hydrolase n=1 Tax=unclassified Streptomyces TaxID=2593676 RepID=UPI0034E23899
MIRALLTDAGGVLFNNITEETSFVRDVAHRYAVDEHRLMRGVQSACAVYESGAGHVHEVLRVLLEEAGSPLVDAFDGEWVDRAYLDSVHCYTANVTALTEVARAFPELTLVLANNEAEHWDRLKNARYGHYGLFDQLCSSWRVGQVKPSAEYFAAALDRCGIEPHEALMIDDRPSVVASAHELGMRTLYVSSPEVLRTRLRGTVESLVPSARG